jgi:uncharacterized protein YaiL (DUF2058 family)
MNWHTTQVNKAKYIARKISPLQFSLYIRKNMKDFFKGLVNKDRIYFSDADIKQIFYFVKKGIIMKNLKVYHLKIIHQ